MLEGALHALAASEKADQAEERADLHALLAAFIAERNVDQAAFIPDLT